MPPVPSAGAIEISLRPDELVAAWRPDSRRLLLPTRAPVRLQQRVAARMTLVGLGVAATINGRVVSASRQDDLHRIEIVPDDLHMLAVERLVSIARGEAVRYQARSPRFLAIVPAVVSGPRGPTYMTTFSVSEKGCGLSWTGPVPPVGARMDVRLGVGARAASFRTVVCWTAQSGRTAMVGVRFEAGPANAWVAMLGDVKRSGAPPA